MEVADAKDDTSLGVNTVRNQKDIWKRAERESDDGRGLGASGGEKTQPRTHRAYWYWETEAGSALKRPPDMARDAGMLGVEVDRDNDMDNLI
jgi:hypothetical protein